MMKLKNPLRRFSKNEIILWLSSVSAVLISFCVFDRENYLTLAASLTGVTSLYELAENEDQAGGGRFGIIHKNIARK